MDLSVLIPTHARPGAVARCVEALAREPDPGARVEVLVGIDGPDRGEGEALARVSAGLELRVIDGPHAGPAATRNRLIEQARGDLLLLLNDDVVPQPGLVRAHLDAHAGRDAPAMVLGAAPFAPTARDSLFDRLIRETSMIFFYDRMSGEDPERDWGFRHAWTLNLSVPTACVRAVGGFCDALPGAAYEDIELAWRVRERFGAPVLFRPGARVIHEHTYEPRAYLEREEALGRDAGALALANPDCAFELFGRDITGEDELDYCAAYVERERVLAERLRATFGSWAGAPADGVPASVVRALYEHHLPLKRWHWRVGRLAGAPQPA